MTDMTVRFLVKTSGRLKVEGGSQASSVRGRALGNFKSQVLKHLESQFKVEKTHCQLFSGTGFLLREWFTTGYIESPQRLKGLYYFGPKKDRDGLK